jgi:predicted  nucleic acid-binding Zn-ribbon protein
MDEKDIEHRLTAVETRVEEVEKRQDDLNELITTVKVLAVREETVENDVKEIKEDVKMLTSKPGKMWDSMIEKIMLTIAAAVIGYILAQVGF